ncbi:MAG TPA: 4Fe-4S dicluster domain-containing protein [Bacillota bacterium]|nr:4Fe-4S dicluster domain-containing protein [Bacillota bacterium]
MKLSFNKAVCSGCRVCEMICAYVHFQANNPRKAAIRIKNSETRGRYAAYYCNQCGACMEACPAGAIHEENGVYRIDRDLCAGCHACVGACSRGLMYTAGDEDIPVKCDLCGECARECPSKALTLEQV